MSVPCRQAFSDTILDCAKSDPRIVTLCTDSRGSVLLGEYANQLPDQFIEVGIAEQNSIGIAAGLANAGLKPFVAGPACFYSMRSAEQVKVDLAYSQSNVKVIGISGGVSYGALGTSHHSLQDIATMTAIPGLTVILPADASQTVEMTKYLTQHVGPVYVRMGRGAVPDVYGSEGITGLPASFTAGKAIRLMVGSDALIIACGETVYPAYAAGLELLKKDIQTTVLDIHTLMPFDEEAILAAAATAKVVVTVEEHSINGGLGSLVAGLLSSSMPKKIKRIAFPNENIVTGSSAEVFKHYGLTTNNIMMQVESLLERG